MSRFLDAVRNAQRGRFESAARAPSREIPPPACAAEASFRVVTVTSNKGGVGKTTLATNLAVYIRALREDLPILLMGLDDQPMPDVMLGLEGAPRGPDVLSGLRAGNLAPAVRLGEYGVHYVPHSPEIAALKAETDDLSCVAAALRASGWRGLVIIDTKSDLEILTRSALAASHLALVVVKDQASLREAARVFALLESWGRPREAARIALSLVDLRVKYRDEDTDVLGLLLSEIRAGGYPVLETFLSRSPVVEALHTNPKGRVLPILHGAPDSITHRQMHHLAGEVLDALGEWPAAATGGSEEPDTAIGLAASSAAR